MRDAREIPLFNHGRIICLEDDNIVSPHFLDFMNESLEYYESEPSILGVSGYSPPIDQERYVSDDVYLSHFWSGWTYAAWQHKSITDYLSQDKPYADMLENKLESRVRRLHPKLHLALKKMDEGTHIAGDQKLSYYMIKHAIYQLRPTKSLVKNIGHDGSGVNCRTSDRFGIEPYAGRLNVALRKLRYLPVLDHLQYRYFHQNENIAKRVARKIWRIINKKSSSLK
jgi:hypothetical protein